MANEVKIDEGQFERLTDLLEGVVGHTDEVASYVERLNEKISELIDTVKAVETAVMGVESAVGESHA